MKKLTLLASSAFILSSCSNYYKVRMLNPNEVVMTEYNTVTEEGRMFAKRHKAEMMEIYGRLSPLYSKTGAGFASIRKVPYALGLFKANAPSKEAHFGATLITGSYFNPKTTSFNQRAAAVFSENYRQALEILVSRQELLKDPRVAGIVLVLAWGNNERPEEAPLFSSAEAVKLLTGTADCLAFLRGEITAQELADRSVIIKYVDDKILGKIRLDLSDIPDSSPKNPEIPSSKF